MLDVLGALVLKMYLNKSVELGSREKFLDYYSLALGVRVVKRNVFEFENLVLDIPYQRVKPLKLKRGVRVVLRL